MESIRSGLPEAIADSEHLARFLTSSSQYNAKGVKPSAFLPNPNDQTTSVFRHDGEPESELWEIGVEDAVGTRTLYGAAIVIVEVVRSAKLAVAANEPPPRHAVICKWPVDQSDAELQKAKHKEIALVIASKARLLLRQ